jgi:hypothetical protein
MSSSKSYDKSAKSSAIILLGLWVLISCILISTSWDDILLRTGWDPDDQLRLVQLRDFMAGQSWFDTTQYRMNPPGGAPMHWSRLIELPLALVMLITRPLFGQAVAEMITVTIVPLIGLGLLAAILSRITKLLSNKEAGIIAFVLTLLSTALLPQFRPMRIDHHGWQTVLAALALWTMFWPDKKRGGIVLGFALAVWMHISLEGLPAAAAFFVLLGWRWIVEKAHGQRLLFTTASFTVVTLILFFGTQSHGLYALPYCDTISPPYIIAIILAAAIMIPVIAIAPDNRWTRVLATAAGGGAALTAVLLIAPQCRGGAFGNLDPLVREYWYIHINEGLPIWHQVPDAALLLLTAPFFGLVAWFVLHTKAQGAANKSNLQTAGYFLIYAILMSLLVFRTVAVAAAFAIPLVAIWMERLFQTYRKSEIPKQRILTVAAILFLAVPAAMVGQIYISVAAVFAPPPNPITVAQELADTKCQSVPSITRLNALPPARFIAPFDISPAIVMATHHAVLASSHHRNESGMRDQIMIFRSAPNTAHNIMAKHGIQYIAACSFDPEMQHYVTKDPHGLWALLARGSVPDWLEPMPDMGKGIKLWRVRR